MHFIGIAALKTQEDMQPQLIVALDIPGTDGITPLVNSLPSDIQWYKVGLELFAGSGPEALLPLRSAGKRIFLDLKLHDIPNTVARAVASVARHGVDLLTLHAGGGRDMLRAAVESAAAFGSARPRLLAVTTLTSLSEEDLRDIGISRGLLEHTLRLGEMAVAAGVDGLICSPHEAREFRRLLGNKPILVTPGIRAAGADVGDQKRVATPEMAIRAGADFLVVGRPILAADSPDSAAREILRQMAAACSGEK